ncbi:unnamed protein product [Heligmosomoides polygyrus]|uniref:Uncharacterized protein n=1 Tax=Heligmosomoides polygyrus TaxID=6339 RepID=A0A183GF46_HELPZ|nr:unnamed protein product [Heligmosomoides polygyrus]
MTATALRSKARRTNGGCRRPYQMRVRECSSAIRLRLECSVAEAKLEIRNTGSESKLRRKARMDKGCGCGGRGHVADESADESPDESNAMTRIVGRFSRETRSRRSQQRCERPACSRSYFSPIEMRENPPQSGMMRWS